MLSKTGYLLIGVSLLYQALGLIFGLVLFSLFLDHLLFIRFMGLGQRFYRRFDMLWQFRPNSYNFSQVIG